MRRSSPTNQGARKSVKGEARASPKGIYAGSIRRVRTTFTAADGTNTTSTNSWLQWVGASYHKPLIYLFRPLDSNRDQDITLIIIQSLIDNCSIATGVDDMDYGQYAVKIHTVPAVMTTPHKSDASE